MNIVITGGSRGIGREIIRKLLTFSYTHIYNIDKQDCITQSTRVRNIKFDLNPVFINTQTDLINNILPDKIDVLINNLGINHLDWFDKLSPCAFDTLMSINVKLPFLLVQKLLDKLKGGTVLNITSNAASLAMTNSFLYNTSKAALHMATKQMSRELGKTHNITVFGIAPNKVSGTDMSEYVSEVVPILRGWTKQEAEEYQLKSMPAGEETCPAILAEFIAFLLSSKDRHKYLQGCILPYGGPERN